MSGTTHQGPTRCDPTEATGCPVADVALAPDVRAFFEQFPDSVFEIGVDGTVRWANQRAGHLSGYPIDELIGVPFTAFVPSDALPSAQACVERAFAGESASIDIQIYHRDGGTVEMAAHITPIFAGGVVAGILGIARDVSAQRLSARQLRAQTERLRALADCSAAFASTLDLDTILETVAQTVADVLSDICAIRLLSDDGQWLVPVAHGSRSPEALDAWSILATTALPISDPVIGPVVRTRNPLLLSDMVIEDIRERLDPNYQPRIRGNPTRSLLIVPLHSRGETIGTVSAISVTADQRFDEDDQRFLQDIADRAAQAVINARLHRKSREAETRFRALVENLPAMTYIGALDDEIMSSEYMSPQIEEILGYTVEEYLADPDLWLRNTHPADLPRVEDHVREAIAHNTPIDVEYRMFRRDGSVCWLHSRASIAVEDGQPLWWQGIVFDITERKQAEAALLESEVRFRAASAASFDAVVILQAVYNEIDEIVDFRFVEANERTATMLDRPVDAIVGKTMREFYPASSATRYIERYRSVLMSGTPFQEIYADTRSGTMPRWYQQQVVPMPGGLLAITAHDITEQKNTEAALREAETRYRTLVEHIPAVTFISSVEEPDLALYISPQIETILGYPVEDWYADAGFWSAHIHPDDLPDADLEHQRTNGSYTPMDIEYRMIGRDGREVWFRNEAVPVHDSDGTPRYWLGLLTDITAQKETAAAIQFQAQLLSAVGQAIIAVDPNNRVTYWNAAAESLTGWSAEEVTGMDASFLAPTDLTEAEIASVSERSATTVPWSGEMRIRQRDDSTVPVLMSSSPVTDASGRLVSNIAVAVDISERKALEEQLTRLAFHDALTGLPNRQLFSDRVNHSLARSRRHGSVLAVLFLDLDNFKVVNDSLGHDIGDQMLVAVAGRLLRCLREEDTAARLGGDEFAILLEDITDMDDASDVAARILTALSDPFVLNGQEVFAAASIGIAISDNTYRSVDELLRDADVAMYGAKRAGRARFAHYEPSMGENALQRLELEIDLRYAIERDELVLHYQPVLNISIDPEGELTGFEALMRWEHPTRGLVAPGDFIPIAEETGLIVELGRWAVERACVQMIEWERTYPDAPWFAISVNISGRQFSDASFVGDVASILAATGVDPFRLIIEITESQMMDDVPSSIRTLRGLRELGVQLAVDDFGTGYSSLSSLRHLPVNHLKIDRSFIETVGTDSDDSIIISGIIGLTHGLGLSAVAEGIETAEQLAKVRDLGCNYAQGFYFSRPLPPGDLTHFLQPVALNRVAD